MKPCSAWKRTGRPCGARGQFQITPSCSHLGSDWPTAYVCSGHLAAGVRLTAARCTTHADGSTVRVREIDSEV